MRAALGRIGLVSAIGLILSGCAGGEPHLLKLDARSDTPNEFAILPSKPLETPKNYANLPAPTPGQGNITDPTPNADAIGALGGNAAVLTRATIPASDGTLVRYASRYGVQADVKQTLAADDLAFRKRKDNTLGRWFGTNRYNKAYKRESLDQYQELGRLRAAGVKTPSVPPNL